jgi:hypothetical protein
VKAIDYAEMPPYDDKWTLTTGSNYPYADANLSAGRLTVFMYPLTNQFSESIDMSPPPASIIISIPEAGYYKLVTII